MPEEIIVATGNKGKLKEIRQILSGCPCVLTSISDYWNPIPHIPEEGATFYENAAGKADWVFSRTGKMSLADDSGLEVDFLSGEPGVRSSRFAGEPVSDQKNIEKLLSLLSCCPLEKRSARFTCVVVLRVSEKEEIVAEGKCEGHIGFSQHGTSGFGYDPVFYPEGFDTTFAELDAGIKNSISHRGKAIANLKEKLYERLILQ
jgi:non-canonical purine NTP pyrophosphatase (RdgB/HAM1 family)